VRVLFVTFTWKTHFFNMVPLAWALQTAGHEVRVASEPPLTDAITGAGLTAVEVGSGETMEQRIRRAQEEGAMPTADQVTPPGPTDALYTIGHDRERLTWEQLTWMYDTVMVPRARLLNDGMVDDLVAQCRSWRPDLILWDAVTHAGPVAAAAVGVPHGRMLFSLDLYRRLRADYLYVQAQQPPESRRDGLRDWYTRWADKYGFEFSEELVNGQFTIDQMPDSYRLDPGEESLAMRYVPYNGPSVVPAWLADPPRAPRVFMTFGVSVRELAELQVMSVEKIQETLDSLADLDIDLVLTLPEEVRDELDRIPANTRVVDFVPMQVIIPSCSVVIHHGGAGSFSGSLLNGVPQVLISKAVDALAKNALVEESNVGLAILPDEASGAGIREAVTRLLDDPSFRTSAERLRQAILTQPSPADLVPKLEELAAAYGAEGGPGSPASST